MLRGHDEGRVDVPLSGGVVLPGNLVVPDAARGIVLFAHGSGSSRFSSRNRAVAGSLRESGLGTLLIDLLTAEEERADERTAQLRFDIKMLAARLVGVMDWLGEYPSTAALRVGLFGASTGGGAALMAATQRPERIAAVVSRGGRPDLAGEALPRVEVPTLLIVGGNDVQVVALNRQALGQMTATRRLEIVPGATHLFEEPGALEEVARLASDWFRQFL
jgi:dienelactone hydrolase